MQIWKLPLDHIGEQEIRVPYNAILRHVAEQHHQLCIWFECDPYASTCVRHIRIYGTGHTLSDSPQEYLGSVLDSDGFVWHVYEALV